MITKFDARTVKRIHGRIRTNKYNSDVDGISTFDVASMFEDMRELLAIIKRITADQPVRESK